MHAPSTARGRPRSRREVSRNTPAQIAPPTGAKARAWVKPRWCSHFPVAPPPTGMMASRSAAMPESAPSHQADLGNFRPKIA